MMDADRYFGNALDEWRKEQQARSLTRAEKYWATAMEAHPEVFGLAPAKPARKRKPKPAQRVGYSVTVLGHCKLIELAPANDRRAWRRAHKTRPSASRSGS